LDRRGAGERGQSSPGCFTHGGLDCPRSPDWLLLLQLTRLAMQPQPLPAALARERLAGQSAVDLDLVAANGTAVMIDRLGLRLGPEERAEARCQLLSPLRWRDDEGGLLQSIDREKVDVAIIAAQGDLIAGGSQLAALDLQVGAQFRLGLQTGHGQMGQPALCVNHDDRRAIEQEETGPDFRSSLEGSRFRQFLQVPEFDGAIATAGD